jgi:DNA-binding LytR/AlgR family response regulator
MADKTLTCLIVDDEDLAVSLLEAYVQKTEGIEVAGTCYHAVEAQKFLQENNADVIFLDIQMPYLTGLEFVKQMQDPPLIIFTTSYSEHAVEAFSLNVMDYLLKPFTYERFLQAVEKAKDFLSLKKQGGETGKDFLFVKSDSILIKIFFDDVLYIEGLKQYVRIVTTAGQVITLESMKKLEDLLPPQQFIRLHKSFIAAIGKIESMSRKEVVIGKKEIPVGKTYEAEWVKRMQQLQ